MAKVIMYTRVPCPYCVSAKRLFSAKGIQIEEIDLTNDWDQLDAIKEKTGWQTVPIILIDGKLIGGYDDLKALDQAGRLDILLK